ncbi:hypothetical protein PFLmoz3_00346 [Pseudomonas fluorescens]|uniref:Uncharacterized protein n=1 Tax=Pseudomonas fluorescens TaxID=294 RepID=A0A120G977_PSEFL|nr:hypothetical protein PFLmoz3_00346 [Pseudomonas fluorescens]
MLKGPFESTGQAIAGRLVDIMCDRWILSLDQALGMQAGPAKPAAHEQTLTTDRNLPTGQLVAG